MWTQNVLICSAALCSVIKFSSIPIFIKLLSTNSGEDAGNNLPADRARRLLAASDCPPHAEYASHRCEDVNNKDVWLYRATHLFPHPPRMHQSNGAKIKIIQKVMEIQGVALLRTDEWDCEIILNCCFVTVNIWQKKRGCEVFFCLLSAFNYLFSAKYFITLPHRAF